MSHNHQCRCGCHTLFNSKFGQVFASKNAKMHRVYKDMVEDLHNSLKHYAANFIINQSYKNTESTDLSDLAMSEFEQFHVMFARVMKQMKYAQEQATKMEQENTEVDPSVLDQLKEMANIKWVQANALKNLMDFLMAVFHGNM